MHHGLMFPKETHSQESLTYFAQQFTFQDDDAIAVTYPKSGQCAFSKHLLQCCLWCVVFLNRVH